MKTTRMRRRIGRSTAVAVFLCLLVPAPGLGALDFTITQLTDGENFDDLPITGISSSGDGSRVIFRSGSDWVGLNPDNACQLFLYDRTTGLSQITFNNPTVLLHADISEDGRWVVYASDQNPVGTNPDGSFELFLVDLDSMVTVALTDSIGVNHSEPKISADGSVVAFSSTGDYTGQNSDGSFEIFRLEITSGTFEQLTSVIGSPVLQDLDMSADASTVAFQSDQDFVPGGNPEGNRELFLHRQGGGFIQATETTSGSHGRRSRLISDGTQVFFGDDADLVGSNPDLNGEIFRFDVTAGLTQVTDTTTIEGLWAAESFSVSGDGSRIAVDSQIDYTGPDPYGGFWGVYVVDVGSGEVSIVGERDLSAVPEISSDGNAVAFWSWSDLTGGNTEREFQMFQAESSRLFADGFETGDTRGWDRTEPEPLPRTHAHGS